MQPHLALPPGGGASAHPCPQFKDQYLELGTVLPSNANIYGLGERVHSLRLDTTPGRTFAIFTTGAHVDPGKGGRLCPPPLDPRRPCAAPYEAAGKGCGARAVCVAGTGRRR